MSQDLVGLPNFDIDAPPMEEQLPVDGDLSKKIKPKKAKVSKPVQEETPADEPKLQPKLRMGVSTDVLEFLDGVPEYKNRFKLKDGDKEIILDLKWMVKFFDKKMPYTSMPIKEFKARVLAENNVPVCVSETTEIVDGNVFDKYGVVRNEEGVSWGLYYNQFLKMRFKVVLKNKYLVFKMPRATNVFITTVNFIEKAKEDGIRQL